MNTMISYSRGKIDDQEWRFLLTGGVALENPYSNPASAWLKEKAWSEITRCSDLPAFFGFMDHFKSNVRHTLDLNTFSDDLKMNFSNVLAFTLFHCFV